MTTMQIIVASTNPVKVAAAEAVFQRIDPAPVLHSVPVNSGVSEQPIGNEETRRGAVNRVQAVMAPGYDYAVAFEGGVIRTEHGLMTCAWCAVLDQNGVLGIGGGANILLPPIARHMIDAGAELGDVMDRLTGEHNTKQHGGAIGVLTGGLMNRREAYQAILTLALARFRKPGFYRK